MRSIAKAAILHSFVAIAFCAAMIAIAAAPAAAKCPPGTLLTEVHRNIDTGKLVPGSGSTLCLQSGKTAHLVADASLSAPKGTYTFLFWDVYGKLHTTPGVSVKTWKSEPAFNATAWYLFQPKCLTPPLCGGGNTNVRTLGFEVDTNKRLPGTPIASVTPATNAWKSPSDGRVHEYVRRHHHRHESAGLHLLEDISTEPSRDHQEHGAQCPTERRSSLSDRVLRTESVPSNLTSRSRRVRARGTSQLIPAAAKLRRGAVHGMRRPTWWPRRTGAMSRG